LHVIETLEITISEKPKYMVRKSRCLEIWVLEVEEARRSTTGFEKSRNPVSRKKKGNFLKICCGC
jgi:hypothetical protein